MRFYTKQHPFYCGIDLHARTMYVCILSPDGEIVLHRNMPASPDAFSRPSRPIGTILSSPSNVSVRGTGSPTCVYRKGCPLSWATPCIGKRALGARTDT